MNFNAKMLFNGRIFSTFGDSIYQIAVIWHIYNLTNSTFYTGLATAFVMIPKTFNFLIAPWIEYINKLKILRYSQLLQFIIMLIIPLSIIFNIENIWLILIVIAIVSFIGNFQGISEVSIIPLLIEKEFITQYNSLISTIQQIISMSMKAVFGLIILIVDIEYFYLFNAFTFLIAFIFFNYIKSQRQIIKQNFNYYNYKKDLAEGFNHMIKSNILSICLPFLILNLVSGVNSSILPAFAEYKIHLNAYGMYLFSMGSGTIIGSALSFKLKKIKLTNLMIIFPFIGFLLWVLSVIIDNGILSIIFLGFANIPIGIINVYLISYLQKNISSDLLGRVAGTLDSLLVSTIPVGALFSGILSKYIAVNWLMIISSFGMLIIAFYFYLNKDKINMANSS